MRLIRSKELSLTKELFEVLHTTDRSQVAVMVLGEGEVSGEFGTDHPESDQVLFVLGGGGVLRCEDATLELRQGDVAIIPAGARHQVIGPNRTLNFYAPAAYAPDGS